MAIITLPASPRFRAAQFGLVSNTKSFVSDFDGTTQTVEFDGAMWGAEVNLPPLTEAEAAPWRAALAGLRGPAGRFYLGDPRRLAPRGSAAGAPGTPQVAGAAQTGSVLNIDGAPASATGYLLVGDYIAVDLPSGGRSLHMATADVDTDGAGAAAVPVAPRLRESPNDNEAILLAPATCVMRLVNNDAAAWDDDERGFTRISISAIEAFNDE